MPGQGLTAVVTGSASGIGRALAGEGAARQARSVGVGRHLRRRASRDGGSPGPANASDLPDRWSAGLIAGGVADRPGSRVQGEMWVASSMGSERKLR